METSCLYCAGERKRAEKEAKIECDWSRLDLRQLLVVLFTMTAKYSLGAGSRHNFHHCSLG